MEENTVSSRNEPSIHIRKSNLLLVVEKLQKQGVITINTNKENLVDQLLKFASPYSISIRAVLVSNKKIQ